MVATKTWCNACKYWYFSDGPRNVDTFYQLVIELPNKIVLMITNSKLLTDPAFI